MPHAALDHPVLVFAGEFAGVGTGVQVRRAVGVALQGDSGHGDGRKFGEPPLQVIVLRFARHAEPPAVIVDHDRDVIRIVERGRGARERGVVERPLRRGELPDELAEIAPVLTVAGPSALGGEVELVPPGVLGPRRQRRPAGGLAADQVPAHRDQGLAAVRPQRRDDVGRPRPPVEAGQDGPLDAERIHQVDDIDGQGRLLAVADRVLGQEAGGPVAAHERDDDPVARRGQHRGGLGEAVNVVRPPVQQKDRRAICRAGFGISDAQQARIDLPQRAERGAHGHILLLLAQLGAVLIWPTGMRQRRPGPLSGCGR